MKKSLWVLAGAALAAVAACSDDDSSSSTTTRSETTLAPTTVAPTTVAPTTVATLPAPSTTAPLPPGLPNDTALAAGDEFRVPRIAIGRGLHFTVPTDGLTGWAGRGGFSLNDAEGNPLIALVDLERAQVFTNPFDDLDILIDEATVAGAVSDEPGDLLAHFAQLPGVEAGDVQPGELLGFQGSSMPFTIASVDEGAPCLGVADKNCLVAFWMAAESPVVLRAGDTGTMYALDVDGRQVFAVVTDHRGAQESLDALVVG